MNWWSMRAIRWIGKRDRDEPFFTCLWFSEPHVPVVAADEFREMYPPGKDRISSGKTSQFRRSASQAAESVEGPRRLFRMRFDVGSSHRTTDAVLGATRT